MAETTTTIDILRHGRTTKDDILRGRIDVPLSEEGYQQMQGRFDYCVAVNKGETPWDTLVTSPLQRCANFCRDKGEQNHIPVAINKGFLEIDFGDYDGKPSEEVYREHPNFFQQLRENPDNFRPPNGECFSDFQQRITDAWHALVVDNRGKHLLLACHGGVIRVLLMHVLNAPITMMSRVDVPYASLSRVKIYHRDGDEQWPQLVFLNP